MESGPKAFEWGRTLAWIEAVYAIRFVRQMKILPCVEICRPTADVRQTLRFRKVCLVPPQFLRQQLLLGNIHRRTDKTFEHSLFNNGNRHCAHVAQLTVRSNDSFYLVETALFFLHAPNGFGHRGPVLWMDEGQILFNRWGSILRIKTVDFVQLIRPIMA